MSHHIDAHYDFYHEPRTIARKGHECDACGGMITKGTVYFRIKWCFEGAIESCNRCMRCQVLHEHLRALGDGDTWPAEMLDCGETYQEHWGDLPPEIAALAFWKPGDPLPQPNRCGLVGRDLNCRNGYWRREPQSQCWPADNRWAPPHQAPERCS